MICLNFPDEVSPLYRRLDVLGLENHEYALPIMGDFALHFLVSARGRGLGMVMTRLSEMYIVRSAKSTAEEGS